MKPSISHGNGLRFHGKYGSFHTTVLEGHELDRLLSRFFWHYDRLAKKHPREGEAFVRAVFQAYLGMYGPNAVL